MSDVDDVTKQAERSVPSLSMAVDRGCSLVNAHDQADTWLQVRISEPHYVANAEVLALGDPRRRAGFGRAVVLALRAALPGIQQRR